MTMALWRVINELDSGEENKTCQINCDNIEFCVNIGYQLLSHTITTVKIKIICINMQDKQIFLCSKKY